MASGLKAAYEESKKEIAKRRALAKFMERMTGLDEDDQQRRLELYARTLGIEEGADYAEMAGSVMGGIGGGLGAVGSGASGMRPAASGLQSAAKSLSGPVGSVAEKLDATPLSGMGKSLHKTSSSMDEFGAKDLSGFTGSTKKFKNSAGGERSFVSGGLSNQIGGIGTAAGDITSLGGNIASLISSAQRMKKGDPAQQLQAGNEISGKVLAIGQSAMSLGKDGISLAQAFGSSGVGAAAAGVLPFFDIVANFMKLVRNGQMIVEHGGRTEETSGIREDAVKDRDEVMRLTASMVFARSLRLAAHYSVELVGSGLSLAGGIVTLTGVGAAIGQGVKLAGTVVSGVNTAARKLSDSYRAGKTIEARTSSLLALPGSAEKMLRDDPKAASQAFIFKAREGNALGLRVLASFGITKDVLDKSSDQNLRALILAKLEVASDPETIGGQVTGGINKLKALLPELGRSIRDFVLKPAEIKELAKAKNALGYGGVKDRGLGWRLKNFFTAPGTVPEQKMQIRKLIEASKMSGPEKEKYIALTYTREERQALKAKAKAPQLEISAPVWVNKPVSMMKPQEVKELVAVTSDVDSGEIQDALNDKTQQMGDELKNQDSEN